MSKKTFILFFSLFFVNYSHAQTDSVPAKTTNKMIISVAGGVAMPGGEVGEYEKTSAT